MSIFCLTELEASDGLVILPRTSEGVLRWPGREWQGPGYSWWQRGQLATFPTPELADAALRDPALELTLKG